MQPIRNELSLPTSGRLCWGIDNLQRRHHGFRRLCATDRNDFRRFEADGVVKVSSVTISSKPTSTSRRRHLRLTDENRAAEEPNLIEQLIDRQLIRAFLASQKIAPVADELQFQIAKAEDTIRKSGDDPNKLLAKIGYTPERLKSGWHCRWHGGSIYARRSQSRVKAYYIGATGIRWNPASWQPDLPQNRQDR